MEMRIPAIFFLICAGAMPAFSQRIRTERFRNRDVASQEIIVRFRGSGSAEAVGQRVRAEDKDIESSTPIGRTSAIRLRARNRSVSELLKDYSTRPDVVYAEPNYVWRASEVPNDTFFGEQWALRNTGQTVVQAGTAGADIGAVQAWDVSEGSRGIVVGMIDSGIDYSQADLVTNMWTAPSAFTVTIGGVNIQCAAGTHGFNAIARTCDPMDFDGHGTHTAGIAGAGGNNTVGVSGVSRVANLMALKFLDNTGAGTTTDAIAAIEFAIQVKQQFPSEANIRVLNASWGGLDFSQALLDEINLAGANEMLFVASAGNSSRDNDATPEYPASYNATNVISVAATDNRDHLAAFSNTGATSVDLAAPGVDILSTLNLSFYGRESGTSMSAAFVSGAASLILSACALSTSDLKSLMFSTVDAIPGLAELTATGGRLNVNSAIRSCAGIAPASFVMSVNPNNQTIAFGTGNQFSVSIDNLNGFSGEVSFSAVNVPAGMTASFAPTSTLSGSTMLTIDLNPTIPQGTYFIGVVATGEGVTRNTGIIVTAGLPSACSVSQGLAQGKLDSTDSASVHRPPAFADYCTLKLDADRAVTIRMSADFDSYLYLLSSTGTVLAADDNSGGGNQAQVSVLLTAGTYTIEATSALPGQTGSYSIFVNPTNPTVSSISPNSAIQGTSVDVTITGTVFFGASVNVKVENCPGTGVSNVQVISTTTVKATLALPNNFGNCLVSVNNSGGESGPAFFTIYPLAPTITGISSNSGLQGQDVTVTLTGTNFVDHPTANFNGAPINPMSLTPTSMTLSFRVGIYLDPGIYYIQVSNNGGSSSVPFTVLLAPPVLFVITPAIGGPGLSLSVALGGTSFTPGVQINAGPKITVTDVSLSGNNLIRATFTVASDAVIGDYPISVTTSAGTTASQIFKVLPTPIVTSYSPSRAFLDKTTTINLTGANFACPMNNVMMDVNLPGLGTSAPTCSSSTTASFSLFVGSAVTVGPRIFTLVASNGMSNPFTIDIVPIPPIIQSVTPAYAAIGTTANVAIAGSKMTSGIVDVSGGGVQATTVNSSETGLTASLMIAANTPIGARSLTVTNASGVSDPVTFYVTPPTWPDLTVIQNLPPVLGSGYDETYSITVRNVGNKESTSPITVVDTLFFNDRFVSNGPGWTCSVSGSNVTCTIVQSIPANSELTFQMVVTTFQGSGSQTNTVEVSSPEDYNVSNNKSTFVSRVDSLSRPKLIVSRASFQPGEQGTISVTMASPFPHDIPGGTVTMTFAPSVQGTPADPAAQLATGGNSVSVSFKATSLTADFAGVAGLLGFQAGTVAGTLTFKLSFPSNSGVGQPVTESVTVVSASPTIKNLTSAKSSSGFETGFTLISSTREVRTLSIQFNTATPIKLSCGGVTGCAAFGSTLTFDVSSLFSTWYGNNSAYGTVATLHVPFNIQGTISGSLTMWLTNSVGSSSHMTFDIP
jgi:hypothetical protein